MFNMILKFAHDVYIWSDFLIFEDSWNTAPFFIHKKQATSM